MDNPMGDSAASHEGTYLEPDERDDEVLTMTRRQLRIIVRELLNLMLPAGPGVRIRALERRLETRIDEKLKDHVRLRTN